MRLFLIFHGRYPSEKAASLFAAKSAESFSGAGADLTLLVPRRMDRIREDPYQYFGLRKNFQTEYIATLDLYSVPILGHLAHYVSYFIFSFATTLYLLIHAERDAIVYSNESLPLLFASIFFANTVYEMHDFPEKKPWLYSQLLRRARRIVVTNRWKAEALVERYGVSLEKITVELNAVDLAPYKNLPEHTVAQTQLGLDTATRKKIVVYTGHLYTWKGVDILCEAASLMPDVAVHVVGGTHNRVEAYKKKYIGIANLHFVGHRPHDEIPLWQRAADVLVVPNTAREEISARYTSPMKLFEYMASQTPIVASRLSSIEAITGHEFALLCAPDDPRTLADAIQESVRNHEAAQVRAVAARRWVEDHTWDRRAQRILSAL